MKFSRMFLWVVAWLAFCASGFAAVPTLINFQGRLTDSLGNPQDSSYAVTFKIYDAPSVGNIVWQETQPSITVTDGIFNVLLGSVTPIVDSVFNVTSRWLTFAVGAESEVTPRARLSSSPYAFRVNTIDGASGGAVGGDIQTSGIVYSSTGGFKFPDGSVQTSASPGSFFQNTFRHFVTLVGNSPVSAFTVPPSKTRYITGIYSAMISSQASSRLSVNIAGSPVIEISQSNTASNTIRNDGFWSSGGGAPLVAQSNEVITLQIVDPTDPGQTVKVLITGFEF